MPLCAQTSDLKHCFTCCLMAVAILVHFFGSSSSAEKRLKKQRLPQTYENTQQCLTCLCAPKRVAQTTSTAPVKCCLLPVITAFCPLVAALSSAEKWGGAGPPVAQSSRSNETPSDSCRCVRRLGCTCIVLAHTNESFGALLNLSSVAAHRDSPPLLARKVKVFVVRVTTLTSEVAAQNNFVKTNADL